MFVNWADIDILTSKSIAMISFAVYCFIFLRFQIGSSVRMLKVILAMFVLGTAAQLMKMYMVPLAKGTAHFDMLTGVSIFICTLSTSTNVANWLVATSYFSAGHKLKQILQNHSSSTMQTSIYASPVNQPCCLDKLCTFWTVTCLFFIDEFLLASILFYDFKKVLQGDTSISQGHVKLSLTIFLGIKNMLALWTTVLLVRSILIIRDNLTKCG